MADIKQASRWMDEGKEVQSKSSGHRGWVLFAGPFGTVKRKGFDQILDAQLTTIDLRADDWEIAP